MTERRARTAPAALLALVIAASSAHAFSTPPDEAAAALPSARLVGQGRMRFFGLEVYEARLWAPSGFDAQRYETGPLALELRYARALRGPAIADRSLQEMRRQAPIDEPQAQAWLALMKRAFPDVQPGERLTGVLREGQVRFFHQGRLTASTDDAVFARLFFGIWLSAATSEPALRRQLLGGGG